MIDLKHLKMPEDIEQRLISAVDILLVKYSSNIKRMILFGSYATQKYQPDSDIDLCIVLNELPGKKERIEYKAAIENNEDEEIDLLYCTEEQLNSNVLIYKWVNDEGIVLYEQL